MFVSVVVIVCGEWKELIDQTEPSEIYTDSLVTLSFDVRLEVYVVR